MQKIIRGIDLYIAVYSWIDMSIKRGVFLSLFLTYSLLSYAQDKNIQYCQVKIIRPKGFVAGGSTYKIYANRMFAFNFKSGSRATIYFRKGNTATMQVSIPTSSKPIIFKAPFISHPDSVYYFKLVAKFDPYIIVVHKIVYELIRMNKEEGEMEYNHLDLYRKPEIIHYESESLYSD